MPVVHRWAFCFLMLSPGALSGALAADGAASLNTTAHINYAAADRAIFVVGTHIESRAHREGHFTHRFKIVSSLSKITAGVLSVNGGPISGSGAFLLPLKVKSGQWSLMTPISTIHRIGEREAPAAMNVLARWQGASDLPVVQRFDGWLGWSNHPIPFVRKASLEALRYHREELQPMMTPSRVAILTTAFEEPESSVRHRGALLSLIGLIGGRSGADWVARSLYTHIPAVLRTRALHILGRADTPRSLRVLRACADNVADGAAPLCRSLYAQRKAADQYR